jgi:hypothetical protein
MAAAKAQAAAPAKMVCTWEIPASRSASMNGRHDAALPGQSSLGDRMSATSV